MGMSLRETGILPADAPGQVGLSVSPSVLHKRL